MLKEKLKALISKMETSDDKKKIENLVVFVIILIITIIALNVIWGGNKENAQTTNDSNKKLALDTQNTQTIATIDSKDEFSSKLEDILQNINGVGKVKVLITYSQTSQTVPMYNEDTTQKDTEETDTNGGSRKVIETDVKRDVIYQESSGQKVPITQSIVSPKIEGAIITAQGAGNANVKADIIQAVEAVTGVSSHKIQVFAMKEN